MISTLITLTSSRTTDIVGKTAFDSSLAFGLTQEVLSFTRLPNIEAHTSLLDLLLTNHPADYQVMVGASLGSSDHCLISSIVSIADRRDLSLRDATSLALQVSRLGRISGIPGFAPMEAAVFRLRQTDSWFHSKLCRVRRRTESALVWCILL